VAGPDYGQNPGELPDTPESQTWATRALLYRRPIRNLLAFWSSHGSQIYSSGGLRRPSGGARRYTLRISSKRPPKRSWTMPPARHDRRPPRNFRAGVTGGWIAARLGRVTEGGALFLAGTVRPHCAASRIEIVHRAGQNAATGMEPKSREKR